MSVSFNNIPSNIRVPLFYAEVDNSQANSAQEVQRTLILGQKLAAGTAVNNTLEFVSRTDDAKTLYGEGSILARMHEIYRGIDPFGEVWCVGIDDASGTQATGTIAFTGPATAAGTINLYIAGQKIAVSVASGDSATVIGAAIAAAVNADGDLPVTAASVTGTVTFTARHDGTLGNDILLQLNYRGLAGNESLPAGVAATITAMASGATDPTLTAAIAALGDEKFDFIIHPFSDTTSLTALKTLMNDTAGRWSYLKKIYGHCYTAKRGTAGALATFGDGINDQHHTIVGIEASMPSPLYEVAAAYGAKNAAFLRADISRPTQTGELVGILPAPAGSRFTITEKQSLLENGIATQVYGGGAVRIERAITTYQKNANNLPDDSYLDSEDMHKIAYVLRDLEGVITSKYGRAALANDGTRFGAGRVVVTPAIARGEIIARCYVLEELGLLENIEVMKQYLIVERSGSNRLNVLFPPDFVNGLRIFALIAQFRLQYPATA